jgi:predicted nuclease of predicted toxin-antitoxin system
MKLLLDQDVYAATVRFLRDSGHDVITASDIGRSRASDSELLGLAHQWERVFVTRDRDFGGLGFLGRLGAGVLYLRTSPSTLRAGHDELERVLKTYSEEELKSAFVVIEPGRHRFRRVSR